MQPTVTQDTRFRGRWLHRYAVFTAFSTFILVIAGGLVTSTGSGLAVPDWPLSYGTFFPPMVGGILYEHGHRMIAGAVALMTFALSFWLRRKEPRPWVRKLGMIAVVAVLAQAALGGITVLFLLPTTVSVGHAGLAMAFFCIVSSLALVTSPRWQDAPPPQPLSGPLPLPRLAAAATAVIYCQILLGATVRHTGSGLACPDFPLCNGEVLPPFSSLGVALHLGHRVGALGVALMVVWVYRRVVSRHTGATRIVVLATLGMALVAVQFLLGALTVWNALAVEPTTAHVGGGALLLVTMLMLTLRAYRRYEVGEIDAKVITTEGALA